MALIKYSDVIRDTKDRLNMMVMSEVISNEERALFLAPRRLARAVTEAVMAYVKNGLPDSFPDLQQDITLTAIRSFNSVNSYTFPEQLFSERLDSGILYVMVNSKELDWEDAISLKEVEHRAKSSLYGKTHACFAFDLKKRRIYTPVCPALVLGALRIPHAVRDQVENENVGITLTVDTAPDTSGNVTLSDGTNDITIALLDSDTASTSAQKIADAVNASSTFYYGAEVNSAVVTLYLLQRGPLNPQLTPSLTDTGSTNIDTTIVDIGTYYLPINLIYADEIVELVVLELLSTKLPAPKKSEA